jgi:dolichyl-phosphate-mannose-protein mannosyltransferase
MPLSARSRGSARNAVIVPAPDGTTAFDASETASWPGAVVLACLASFGLALVFIFVRAPHPWGWEGFDNYRALGLALARGEGFSTFEVPWGYPAFLALLYRLFGDRQWVPLVVQGLLNATIPAMLYRLARPRFGDRIAIVASLLVAMLSFNTVYASTQTSDAVCTVVIVAAVLTFDRGVRRGSVWSFAASGMLCGVALQLRPHFLLFSGWLVAAAWLLHRRRPKFSHVAVCLAATLLAWLPWTIRNYRLSGRFIPATTHGGVQLWYGSLQVGEYFWRWYDNPRAVGGQPVFDVSAPTATGAIVTVEPNMYFECARAMPRSVALTYWTDRDPRPVVLPAVAPDRFHRAVFSIPGQPEGTEVYYFFDAVWAQHDGTLELQRTPPAGARDPLIHFVTRDWSADVDRQGDLLDVFDVVRIARHVAFGEPVPNASQLDFDSDGRVTTHDLNLAIGALLTTDARLQDVVAADTTTVERFTYDDRRMSIALTDGSTLSVPRRFSGRLQDLDARGERALAVLRTRRSFAGLRLTAAEEPLLDTARQCQVMDAAIDRIFYRSEPQEQDRYLQLALENIRRTPFAFAAAVARRAVGLFVVAGSADRLRAHQFEGSSLMYAIAALLSWTYLASFVAGVVIARRRGLDVALLLAAIIYVPVMISAFLANMRYSVSAQPFVFPFIATAVTAVVDRWHSRS